MRRALAAGGLLLLVFQSPSLASDGSGIAGLYSRGDAVGVSATARIGFSVSGSESASHTSHASPSTTTGVSAGGPPAPVAISAHNCIPRSQPVGVSLSFEIVESPIGDCISFVSPEPLPDRPARGPRRAPRPSPESLAQRAFDRVISLAPDPELGIAPARVGLTGLPSYFWVDGELAPVTATAGVRGLTVTAEARPVRYQWDFDDGTTRSTQHGGRPWTRGRDGNVGHVYETKGRYEPGITVLWAARWRVNGGPWADLGYFSTIGSAEYPVREMIAALVRRR